MTKPLIMKQILLTIVITLISINHLGCKDIELTSGIKTSKEQVYTSKKTPEPRGIINVGNTCYINSAFQALFSCKEFMAELAEFANKNNKSELLNTFIKLYNNEQVDIKEYINDIGNSLNRDLFNQDDPKNFIERFIPLLHSEIKKQHPTKSKKFELILNKIRYLMQSDDCDQDIIFEELGVAENFDLVKKIEVKSYFPITRVPHYLFIHLNHTSPSPDHINIPPTINDLRGKQVVYRLLTSVNHIGSSWKSGHYIAEVFQKEHIYTFNDSYVSVKDRAINENIKRAAIIVVYEKIE